MSHVDGEDDGVGYGVSGVSLSPSGVGVVGLSDKYAGVYGQCNDPNGVGVYGYSYNGISVRGRSYSGIAVDAYSYNGFGVVSISNSGIGVTGASESWIGVTGTSTSSYGVYGASYSSYGVYGRTYNGIGLYGFSDRPSGYAAYLNGRVYIRGPLSKPGGQFKIDHPLDPANKYLCHSFVESPDMKNVYDGVVVLDNNGEAEIELTDWFGALNKDFRYQLTAIGAPGPNLYIAEEIISNTSTTGTTTEHDSYDGNYNNKRNRFKIAGGKSGMKVSWQVTGIRKDPWANANRIRVEEDKPASERGYYIYPELYGQPKENGISHLIFPEKEKQELLINKIKA